MALQGDLDSFALPDVLRLLSTTTKGGRLAVASRIGSGEVWLRATVTWSAGPSPRPPTHRHRRRWCSWCRRWTGG